MLKRLGSLGYVSRSTGFTKESFGPQDDVKVLLPFHNKVFEAMTLYGEGRAGDAVEMLKQVIKVRKDIGIAYYLLGFVFMNEGRMNEALEILRMGLSNVPGDYNVYRNYVKTLRRAQKYDEIIENFHERSYKEISSDPEIWNNLGFAYAKKEKWESAIESYNYALSLDSKFAEAFYNLGDAYLTMAINKKDTDLVKTALPQFQLAIAADPRYPSPYFGSGRAYRIMRDPEAAMQNLKKAVELQPDFDAAYYYLGLTHLDIGEKSQALACFTTIKEKFSSAYTEEQNRRIDELIKHCKDN
jgi:tetratricopeptide (TPR) repeat protein